MKNSNLTDSELIKYLMKYLGIKNQKDLGLNLGMGPKSAKTYISNIVNGSKPLPEKYILAIINKYPDFAKKYGLMPQTRKEDEITIAEEPNSIYSNHKKKEKMEQLELCVTELKIHVSGLQDDMAIIKHQLRQLLEMNRASEQSEEAV